MKRMETVRKTLESRNLSALILFSPVRIFYLTGYTVIPTERPIAFILPVAEEPALFIPKLEEEHSKFRVPHIKKRIVYFEYPGIEHPMKVLAKAFNHHFDILRHKCRS